jgi:hypothetical protein
VRRWMRKADQFKVDAISEYLDCNCSLIVSGRMVGCLLTTRALAVKPSL